MTEKELQEHLLAIYNSLDVLTRAVKLLLNESEAREEEIFRTDAGPFKHMNEDVNKFFRSMENDKKRN